MNSQTSELTLDIIVRQVIEEVTGNLFKDIRFDSDVVDDLGITKLELASIIKSAEHRLEISLSENAKREILMAHTVGDVIDIIEEEYEY